MGLERRTGNELNWMAVKALGQSGLVVMWDNVNRLLLDCNWTVVSLSHLSSQINLPVMFGKYEKMQHGRSLTAPVSCYWTV